MGEVSRARPPGDPLRKVKRKKLKHEYQKKTHDLQQRKRVVEEELQQLKDQPNSNPNDENRLIEDIKKADVEMTEINGDQNNFVEYEEDTGINDPEDPNAGQVSNASGAMDAPVLSIENGREEITDDNPQQDGLRNVMEHGLLDPDEVQGRPLLDGQGIPTANAGRFGMVCRLGTQQAPLYMFVKGKAAEAPDITDYVAGSHRRCDRIAGAKNVYQGKKENIRNYYGIVWDWQGRDPEEALQLLDPQLVKHTDKLKTMTERRKWQKAQRERKDTMLSRFPVGYILVGWKDDETLTWETFSSFKRMYKDDPMQGERVVFRCATLQHQIFMASKEGRIIREQSGLMSRGVTPVTQDPPEQRQRQDLGRAATPNNAHPTPPPERERGRITDSRSLGRAATWNNANPTPPPESEPRPTTVSANSDSDEEKEAAWKDYLANYLKQRKIEDESQLGKREKIGLRGAFEGYWFSA